VGAADGAWVFVSVTIDRDGDAIFGVNGAQLGAPVDISALATVDQTSTQALIWWWDSFFTYTAGTLGECWIISGLLSASRIADIYRAGSIAPFCSYSANTTTGVPVATIDGLD